MIEESEYILNEMLEMQNSILIIRQQNQDDRTKNIGDIVKVWDGSYNRDAKTGEHRSGIDDLFKKTAKVIAIDQRENILDYNKNVVYLDLLLRFDNGVEVYCNSDMVKIIKLAEEIK